MRLRPHKSCDAKYIAEWCKDETVYFQWSAGRFGSYPVTAEIIDRKYREQNGGCVESDNFYPMTAFEGDRVIGHLIMRYLHGNNRILRFGWVIIDETLRGTGCGKEMLLLALKYAFEIQKVDKVTLGVFDNNPAAYHCYKSIGFRESEISPSEYEGPDKTIWRVIELEISQEEYAGNCP